MTRSVQVGGIAIGGGAPVSIQSMTNTDTRDVEATLSQIRALAKERASDWPYVRHSIDAVLARSWRTDSKSIRPRAQARQSGGAKA